ncbi:hypothetical protein SAMN05444008_12226 [Cnuella takakiae]|uniref:Uncharacterized protein n=1 Tax=Cnuella takakiae TaxID=1302690 RepID=A0A1M5I6W3_9BACT|nr:hypothetical protein SAMN05444008_12226 [Cnuella takakiae]
MGLQVLRFTEKEAQYDTEEVIKKLNTWIDDYERTHPEVVGKNVRKMRGGG